MGSWGGGVHEGGDKSPRFPLSEKNVRSSRFLRNMMHTIRVMVC